MSTEAIECIYEIGGMPPRRAWDRISSWVTGRSIDQDSLMLYGTTLTSQSVGAYLDEKRLEHFFIEGNGCAIRYSPVGAFEHCLVTIQCDETVRVDEWVALASMLATSQLVTARVYNLEYEFWQNASDPLQYTARGRSYEGLSLQSNALPFPLERKVIDTSRNPGRRVLRRGYVEAVGAIMWLGPTFAARTGSRVEDICERWNAKCGPGEVVELRVFPNCFESASGVEGELQDRLRYSLFPEARVNGG